MQIPDQELVAEGLRAASNPYDTLSRLSFWARRELLLAATAINPSDPFSTVCSSHTTVATNALTNHRNRGA